MISAPPSLRMRLSDPHYRLFVDGSAPLAGIFFLKHGKTNCINELEAATAVDRLLPLASIPWYDHETMAPIIAFAERLAAKVPAYEMNFTPDRSVTDFFSKFIK